jgi:hypothetical protein
MCALNRLAEWERSHRIIHITEKNVSIYIGLARTICTPYMTVLLMTSLPKIYYVHRTYMVLANPACTITQVGQRPRLL